MTTYTLSSPMVIGSRLMPAVTIGETGVIHAEIDRYDGERYVLRYVIEMGGKTYQAADIRTGVTMPTEDDAALSLTLRSLMGTLLSFLGAAAERYDSWMNSGGGRPSEGWMFSREVDAWAYGNSDEIDMARCEFDGEQE